MWLVFQNEGSSLNPTALTDGEHQLKVETDLSGY